MLAEKATRSLPSSNGEIRVRVPQRFSIIDNPETVLDLLTAFAHGVHVQKIQKVLFDHRDLKECDLAANSLLDVVATERNAELKWRRAKRKLRVVGFYPTNPGVKRFIKATGIIKHMEIAHEALSHDETKTMRVFEARNKSYFSPTDGSKADYKDKQQARFVDHIQGCLRDHGYELSALGMQTLGAYLGEILANAEDHAEYLDWTVQGYLDNTLAVPMCEIAIFNFGRSIAESMQSVSKEGYTWNQIRPYLDMHAQRRLFGASWREEDLLTVIALQSHVSRLNTSEQTTRGQGTVELIEFFQRINDFCNGATGHARMAIVSGGTYILFDGTYRMIAPSADAGKIIAFNETNDLNERPDPKFVKSLGEHRFPGTIISIKFPLSLAGSSLVEEVTNGSANDN
ncbi:hypothetical protein WL18_19240 [Burkholderia ubonensis]|nr:hypothetical protein WL18_19240 [Burkholderia ubonensis]